MKPGLLNAKIFIALSVTLLSCRNSPSLVDAPSHLDTKCAAYAVQGIEVSCLTIKQATYVIIDVDLTAALIKLDFIHSRRITHGVS
jgi:hypothetical protein